MQQLPLHRRQSGVHKGKTSHLKVVPAHSCCSSLSNTPSEEKQQPVRELRQTVHCHLNARLLSLFIVLKEIVILSTKRDGECLVVGTAGQCALQC